MIGQRPSRAGKRDARFGRGALGLARAGAVLACIASTDAFARAGGGDLAYTHDGESRALAVDTGAIVVRHAFDDAALVAVPLAKVGVTTAVHAWYLPDAAAVEVPPAERSPREVHALVTDLAVEDGIAFASPRLLDPDGNALVLTNELLVAFEPTVGDVLARQLLLPYGEVLERDPAGLAGTYLVRTEFRSGYDVLAASEVLAARPETRWCDPNFLLEVTRDHVPNDPLFPSQWALSNSGQLGGPGGFDLDAPDAWDLTTGDASIVVAVLDDGVQQDHPDLSQLPGVDFTGSGTNGGPDTACDRHGTAVAGCIAAGIDNGIGTTGVAPGVRVQGLKVITTSTVCNGQGVFQTSWFLDALEHCRTSGVRVTNTSLGFAPVTAITSKFASTRDEGIVHFASSGNSGGAIGYPASAPAVNAVGAIAADGTLASFSCFGSEQAFVAPGQVVWTIDRSGTDGYAGADYTTLSGTSFASPFTAGVAALVLSVDATLSAAEVETVMANTALDLGASGHDAAFGHGLVRAGAAVHAASASVVANTPPSIAAVTPGAAPVLVPDGGGTLSILGANLTSATGVRLGGTTLDPSDVTVVDDGRIDLRYTRLPWLGPVDLEVLHAGGAELAQVTSEPVSAPTLDLTDSWPDGLDRSFGMQVHVASQPGDLVYLIGSLVHAPTPVPGIIDCALGGGDVLQLHLLSVTSVSPVTGTSFVLVPIAGLPLGLDVHLQGGIVAIAMPALPLLPTNVQSGTVQF